MPGVFKKNRKRIGIALGIGLFFLPGTMMAQLNAGFESGLTGWSTRGQVVLDSSQPKDGTLCARLGPGSRLQQKVDVLPFSVLQFGIYIKCSAPALKAHSFIRFYDRDDRELLTYRSSAMSPLAYQQAGDYTEAPATTQYMFIGVETDTAGQGFAFADNCMLELNIGTAGSKITPRCDLDAYMRPFWETDTVCNETVLLYAENGKPATGRLLFTPEKIISVKNYAQDKEYAAGIDYRITNNSITRIPGSDMVFRADTSFDLKKDLAWYNLQSQWITVTYTHKDKWQRPIPLYRGNQLPSVMHKLITGSKLTIIAYGMSITRGLDVSSYDSVAPFMPAYVDLFARQLRKMYFSDSVILYNAGLPGALVSWGADYAEAYLNPVKPDLVIIDFGMNDFWRYDPAQFKQYIQSIIAKVKKSNPATEFLLLSNMKFDPDYILDSDPNKKYYLSNMDGYNQVLKQLETTGIVDLDMNSISDELYHRKKAKDCLANPLHPNDYLARWYAQTMFALFWQAHSPNNKEKK